MASLPVYIAILTSRRLSDVLVVFPTDAEAIAQCRSWLRKTSTAKEEAVPGLVFWAQYGTQDDTVRVERHLLEVSEHVLAVPSYQLRGAETVDTLLHLDLDGTASEVPDA